jgi:phosphatidylglycerophosphatase A
LTPSSTLYDRDGHDPKGFSGAPISLLICYESFPVVPLYWKTSLLGFILFRAFDIWKPFPARQLEHLPGGWGIMADDWMAGIYAALVLHVALHFRVL